MIKVKRVDAPARIGGSERYRVMLTLPPEGWLMNFLKIATRDQGISQIALEAEGSTLSFASSAERLQDDVRQIDEWIEKTNAEQEGA